MSKPGMNIKKNFNYKKLGDKLPDIMAENLNVLGNWINKGIQDGLKNGEDINEKPFKQLKQSTKDMRGSDGGSKPLVRRGHLGKTQKTPATPANPIFKIEMKGKSQVTLPKINDKKVKRRNAGTIYGAFHNQPGGYTTSPDSAVPNKKVPQRQWFGIPKSCLPGGKNYEKATLNRRFRIQKAIKTIMK